jgi:3-isopropylmalate/(R)-2-methylmalate dehydratase small subunit
MSELERIERRSGRAVVVRGDDIDTDQIIPARFMRSVSFAGLEEHVFTDVRRTPDGALKGHPFDDERYAGASILVVNRNFGCGSSREHAPRALARWGIRAILGESFAEIFFGNCTAMGVPAVTASRADIAALMDAIELDPTQVITLDIGAMTVTSRAGTIPIVIPNGARAQLLNGTWDAVRTLRVASDKIHEIAARLPYVAGF